jgi:hypothetical protein
LRYRRLADVVRLNDDLTDITRFVNYEDLADWREPLVGTLTAELPRRRPLSLLGFTDIDDTLKCSGGGKGGPCLTAPRQRCILPATDIAGTDRSCRNPDCTRAFDFYTGAGAFWRMMKPEALYLTSARPAVLGRPNSTLEYLWTEAGIEGEMIYGSLTDNDSMHSKDRYRNYGQTKCRKTMETVEPWLRAGKDVSVVVVGDDGQGDVFWMQCVRDKLRDYNSGRWWRRWQPWIPPAEALALVEAEPGLLNKGKKCWHACGAQHGSCPGFCGGGGFCCRQGARNVVFGCDGSIGGEKKHTCVPAPPPGLLNAGRACLEACGSPGSCLGFCGTGLCCRSGSTEGVCDGRLGISGVEEHVCVHDPVRREAGWWPWSSRAARGRSKWSFMDYKPKSRVPDSDIDEFLFGRPEDEEVTTFV